MKMKLALVFVIVAGSFEYKASAQGTPICNTGLVQIRYDTSPPLRHKPNGAFFECLFTSDIPFEMSLDVYVLGTQSGNANKPGIYVLDRNITRARSRLVAGGYFQQGEFTSTSVKDVQPGHYRIRFDNEEKHGKNKTTTFKVYIGGKVP